MWNRCVSRPQWNIRTTSMLTEDTSHWKMKTFNLPSGTMCLKMYEQTNWCQNCLKPLMYRAVFYLAGLRLSTVFCTLTLAGVQSTNSKTKATLSVLLPYLLIISDSSEVIVTFTSRVHPNQLGALYLGVLCSQYLWKSWRDRLVDMKSFLCLT